MTELKDSYRLATIILVNEDGEALGQLVPVRLSLPWLQEVTELVDTVRREFGLSIMILRLSEVDDTHLPEIKVSYFAEIKSPEVKGVRLQPWAGQVDEQPLRLPYAEAGGPDNELSWAREMLKQRGCGEVVEQIQIRTWNLSSIWKLRTENETFWLKSIPPFFSHEGTALKLFSNEHIPDLVAADEQRVLLRNLPGEDCYDASPKQMLHMVDRLVDLQWRWHNRLNALFDAGIPSAQSDVLLKCIPDVVNLRLSELSVEHQARLIAFRQTLPERLDRLEACGFPATLVHGDYHPGNWRGAGMDLSILDWGDCCVGHPLLDLPALIDRAGEHAPKLLSHWQQAWQTRLPDADIETAIHLLTPVAYARMAAVYQHFLENIEPAERVFHERDPAIALEKAANALPEA